MTLVKIGEVLMGRRSRRVAVADFILREYVSFQTMRGIILSTEILPLTPYVIESNVCFLDDSGELTLRLSLLHYALQYDHTLDATITAFLQHISSRSHQLKVHWQCVEDQQSLRRQVMASGGVAFIGDGAVLPRVGGRDQSPHPSAVPFESPANLRRAFLLPYAGEVTGMLIPRGVTVITGGGKHTRFPSQDLSSSILSLN